MTSMSREFVAARAANDTHLPTPFHFGASRKVAKAFGRIAALDLPDCDGPRVVRVYKAAILVRGLQAAWLALDKARRTRQDDAILREIHVVLQRLRLPLRITDTLIRAAGIVIAEVHDALRLQDVKRRRKYPKAVSDIDILECLIDHSTHEAAEKFGLHQSTVWDRRRGILETLSKQFQAFIPTQTRQKTHRGPIYRKPSGRVGKPKCPSGEFLNQVNQL
jgi:hypothetical protein